MNIDSDRLALHNVHILMMNSAEDNNVFKRTYLRNCVQYIIKRGTTWEIRLLRNGKLNIFTANLGSTFNDFTNISNLSEDAIWWCRVTDSLVECVLPIEYLNEFYNVLL
jgi:hypothetical protein